MNRIKLNNSKNYQKEIKTINNNYQMIVNHLNNIKIYSNFLSQIWARERFNKNGNKVTPKIHKIYSELDFKPAKADLKHQKSLYNNTNSKKKRYHLKSKIESLKFIINQGQTWCCDFLDDNACEIDNVDVATLTKKLKNTL